MSAEANVAYLRQKGIHILLERLARGLLTLTPEDPLEYMIQELAKARLFTWPQQQYTGSEMDAKLSRIVPAFVGVSVVPRENGEPYAPLAICSGNSMKPQLMDDIADCLTYSFNFTKADVIVGAATHTIGALVHACSCHTGQAYSLSNWYPKGLGGDIHIPSASRAGAGDVYLNSITKGHRVVLLSDVLWGGQRTMEHAMAIVHSGATLVALVFAGECTTCNGRDFIKKKLPDVEIHSLVRFSASKAVTELDGGLGHLSGVSVKQPYLQYTCPPNQNVLDLKKNCVERSFVGIPIQETPAGYPYCKFCLTDFVPLMSPELVEDMADTIVATSNIRDADVLVAMSDRGGGPVSHSCSVRLGKPYILADWYPITEEKKGVRTFQTMGTKASIKVNGLVAGQKVFILGDMLSSGGSQEILCRIIQDQKCTVVGCAFVSEKVNLNGRKRLTDAFPEMKLTSLCRFVAEPADPTLRVGGGGLRYSEKFKDLDLKIEQTDDGSPEAPRGGGLSAGRPKQSVPEAPVAPPPKKEQEKRPALTKKQIEKKLDSIRKMFEGINCFELDKKPYAAFAFNETVPPMEPEWMDDVADVMTYITDFSQAKVIVSAAVHAAGALIHACACRTGQPYSLSNWYPAGLDGDIKIKECIGLTGQNGIVYLNCVGKDDKCIFVDDVLWASSNVEEHVKPMQAAGASITAVLFIAEAVNLGGRAALEKLLPGVPIISLVKFNATLKQPVQLDAYRPAIPDQPAKAYDVCFRESTYQEKVDRTLASFVGVSIQQTSLGYPYCKFALTDFSPLLQPDLVEEMAECCVMMANFDEADIIVSESDRGGGPLVHACAYRSGLPYCLANWYPLEEGSKTTNTSTTTEIGFAGSGTIYVHGLKPGMKVMVVDDMLSSGGTGEALIRCVKKAGCEVVGAMFVSEKVNLNGRKRLLDLFPEIKVFAVCKFIAEPADPLLYSGTISKTVAFQELAFSFGGKGLGGGIAAPRGGKTAEPVAQEEELVEPEPVRRR